MCGLYYRPDARQPSLLASGAKYGIGNNGLGYTQVTHYRNRTWCCNNGNTTCRNNNEGFFLSKDSNEITHSPLAELTASKWLTTMTALLASSGTFITVSQVENNLSELSTSDKIKIGLSTLGAIAGVITIGSGVYKWRQKYTKR